MNRLIEYISYVSESVDVLHAYLKMVDAKITHKRSAYLS